ncbi:Oidioi.mRNA.OKI2018_I69.chr2.g6513.t1.cds [Oikopleura dioica]|uniref:Oidioi.mRNA.OKI2018_I69.chr2.g6513.t1.cds n=1 Tax=Oikopleura dioica TaxID=34765 RepID=A0ABN7T834_OIKDI|nr:Oidioi.mRNA.OKI2018_I69.chr2.g6513.t1.cds [Oikopleura dioica]
MNDGMQDLCEELKFDLVSYSPGPFPGAFAASKGGVLDEVKSIFERHRHRPERRRHTVYVRLPCDSIITEISVRLPPETAASINDVLNADFSFYVGGSQKDSNIRRLGELYHETSPLSCSWLFQYRDISSTILEKTESLIPSNALVIESDICGHSFDSGSMILELRGTAAPDIVKKFNRVRAENSQLQAHKMTLKYLRSNGYVDAYRALLSSSDGRKLEASIVTRLFEELVTEGNYQSVEKLLQDPEFSEVLVQKTPIGAWRRIKMKKVTDSWPAPRGGHQMVTYNSKLYLHGGWTGTSELGDFWQYDFLSEQWKMVTNDAQVQDGPSPRCCHKMAIDRTSGTIFFLGRYVDNIGQQKKRIPNDFYKYEINSNKWALISEDVEKEGGPPLIYDHQMLFSEKTGDLVCFGGRVLQRTTRIEDFSLDDFQPTSPIRSNYGNFYKWVWPCGSIP